MTIAYAEAYKNLELAEFALKNKTPFITVIDYPISPIQPMTKSKIQALLLGGLIGGLLFVFYVIVNKLIKEIVE